MDRWRSGQQGKLVPLCPQLLLFPITHGDHAISVHYTSPRQGLTTLGTFTIHWTFITSLLLMSQCRPRARQQPQSVLSPIPLPSAPEASASVRSEGQARPILTLSHTVRWGVLGASGQGKWETQQL